MPKSNEKSADSACKKVYHSLPAPRLPDSADWLLPHSAPAPAAPPALCLPGLGRAIQWPSNCTALLRSGRVAPPPPCIATFKRDCTVHISLHLRFQLLVLINVPCSIPAYSHHCPEAGADPGGGHLCGRPPLGLRGTIQCTPFSTIQAPVHHCAPSSGIYSVSAPA